MATDGTEKLKDEVSTPEVKQETPKETYTEEEVKKLKVDFRTAAEAEVGRATEAALKSAKQAETSAKQAERALAGLTKFKEQARAAELEINKDQPNTLDVIRARHAKEELEDELAAKNAELEITKQTMETIRTQTEEATRAKDAQEIATRFQVDVNDLLLTDGSKEAMEKLAQKLTKVETTPLRVDPGGGVGSSESFETLLKPLPRDASYQDILEREQELKSAMKAQ